MRKLFITGIGTDVGKTVASAVITEALTADYWKPVQSGDLDNSDTKKIATLISNDRTNFWPEAYRLPLPLSPHASAASVGVAIRLDEIKLPPVTNNVLVIEGAGGLFAPLNEKQTVADLIGHLDCEVLLVSRNYLGSINHTMLTVAALESRKYPILGVVFSGESVPSSESWLVDNCGLKVLFSIPWTDDVNRRWVKDIASSVRRVLSTTTPPRNSLLAND